jgi:general secretion pathway protein I
VIHPCEVSSRQRGFTLIEVLVALAIVAIGMAAVLGTLTSSASTVVYMHDKTLANWVALNHIAEQRLQPQPPALGKTDGDVDYAGQTWHWRQDTVATAVKGMVRLDVMVRPADIKTDEDRGWYVTLSGIMGDAVSAPRGDMPLWGTGSMMPGMNPGQNQNGLNQNGQNPGQNGQTTNGGIMGTHGGNPANPQINNPGTNNLGQQNPQ